MAISFPLDQDFSLLRTRNLYYCY